MTDSHQDLSIFVNVPLRIEISLGAPVLGSGAIAITPSTVTKQELFQEGTAIAQDLNNRFSISSLTAGDFTWKTALSLGLASNLAYSSSESVRQTALATWRLKRCIFIEAGSMQCFVASSEAAILVAFRGTDNTRDWLTNLNLRSIDATYGTVHRGFYHAFQTLSDSAEDVIEDMGDLPVLLTGHSLGGALATIAAAEWREKFRISRVYTFGQPALGKRNFVSFMGLNYARNFHRFVNDDDIVPRVPPGFQHVGRLIQFDGNGELDTFNEGLAEAPALESDSDVMTESEFRALQEQLRPDPEAFHPVQESVIVEEGLFPSFKDHKMANYLSRIAKFA